MKFLLVLSFCIVGSLAVPVDLGDYFPLLQRTEVHDEAGQYSLRYTTADGTSVGERGVLKPTNDGLSHVLVKEGDFSWTAPDGQMFRTTYVADQHGYRAHGDHLPGNQ